MIRLLLLMLPLMLLACSSAPPPRQPLMIEQAQAADQDARKALRDGDLPRARDGFAQALVLQQSLDDTAGAATTLINLATVEHRLRDDTAALAALDRVLQENERIYPAEARLTAVFRKAVILADLARMDEAGASLQSAEKLCAQKCSLRYGVDALRARLQLQQGDTQGALALALEVGKHDGAGREEQANALRIAALAEEKLSRPADALQHFRSALEMDKALGLSARIGEDLGGMARAARSLGQVDDAAEYARRAALASAARGRNQE